MKTPTIEELREHPFHMKPYVKRNYPDLYDHILSQEGTFPEALWRYYNGSPEPCPVCGKSTKFVNFFVGYREFCSSKCQAVGVQGRREKTMMERYGTKNIMHVPEFYEKVQEKNPFKDPKVQKQIQKKQVERYGGMARGSKETREKIDAAKEEKYGDPYFNNREKYAETCMERYGRIGYCDEEKRLQTARENFIKSNDRGVIGYTEDGDWIVRCPHPECDKCEEKTFVTPSGICITRANNGGELCTKIQPVGSTTSSGERDMVDFIGSIYDGEIREDIREIYFDTTYPKEIDCYLPNLGLGIEFNGLYWHSLEQKELEYHLKKWINAREKGIRLITIWEDDWRDRKDWCKEFIKNQLSGRSIIEDPDWIYLDSCSEEEWQQIDLDKVELYEQERNGYSVAGPGRIKREI